MSWSPLGTVCFKNFILCTCINCVHKITKGQKEHFLDNTTWFELGNQNLLTYEVEVYDRTTRPQIILKAVHCLHNWGLNADYATINGNLGNLLWDCSGIEVSDQNIQWFQIFNFTFNLSASIIS